MLILLKLDGAGDSCENSDSDDGRRYEGNCAENQDHTYSGNLIGG